MKKTQCRYGRCFFKGNWNLTLWELDIKKPSVCQMVFLFYRVNNYFPLLASRMYFLRPLSLKAHLAMVPRYRFLNHCPKLLFCVVLQNGYSSIVLFKLRKFLNNDLIPVGLKKLVYHNTRPLDQKDRSLLFCKTAGVQSTFNPFSVVVASAFNWSDAGKKFRLYIFFFIKGDKSAKSFGPT
jgi:hypothetical protein